MIKPIMSGESVMLKPLINASTIDDFGGSPTEGILNPGNLIAEVSPEETTVYTLTLYFEDCVKTRSVLVEVIQPMELYIPNIFNSNDFGPDRCFYQRAPASLDYAIDAMHTYDRWGNLVFENQNFKVNDENESWDGYYNDQPVDIGVYTYLLIYKIRVEEEQMVGKVTVIS